MVRFLLQVALLMLAALYAWRKGGWPEKAAACVLVGLLAIDQTYHALFRAPRFEELDLWHMSLDIFTLAVIVWLALRAPRVWILWLASLQTISALGHFLHILEVAMPVEVYWAMVTAPSWLQILLLGVGTYLSDRTRENRPIT